jgi:hypothetical protein
MLRDEGGQAFVETAIFLPLMVFALMAIILIARLGVLSERAESAVRYGDLVSYRNGAAYTTSAVGYLLNQAVYHNTSTQLLDLCLAPASGSATPDANSGVNSDIRAALYQQQVVASTATAAPAPQAFFKADGITQPNCTAGSIDLNGKGSAAQPTAGQYSAGNLPVSVDGFSITASVGMDNYIASIFHGNGCSISNGRTCTSTTGSMAFINVAAPTTLIACVSSLSAVLQIMNPSATIPSCNT